MESTRPEMDSLSLSFFRSHSLFPSLSVFFLSLSLRVPLDLAHCLGVRLYADTDYAVNGPSLRRRHATADVADVPCGP